MIAVVRHEAQLRQPVKGATGSQGEHLKALARQGVAFAIQKLEGPAYPEALRELHGRFLRLSTMRPVHQAGFLPVTHLEIDAANRLYDWQLEPHEVEALHQLDVVDLYPNAGGDA